MAHRTISDEQFNETALDLFRTYGYEGVSLQKLSAATGLEKASLYYRYPGGKDEIAKSVVQGTIRWFQTNIFEVFLSDLSPRRKAAAVVDRLRAFYGGGRKSCITDILSILGGPAELRAELKTALQAWLEAFAKLGRQSGMSAPTAKARAEEAIARIEGSLILARVLQDTGPFERTLKLLPDLLTEE
jgi:TetR/AcrR family transcriptional repressor of lmrAB and yxaGH operons